MGYLWIPIHDGTYEALNCDKLTSSKWNEDAVILSVVRMVLCLEVLFVCLTLCCLFCYLRRLQAHRQLTTLLKRFLYHTGINCIVVGCVTLMAIYCVYRYYRHPSKKLSGAVYALTSIVEPLLVFISVVAQSLLSIRHQNGRYCGQYCTILGGICCKTKNEAQRQFMNTDRNENQTNPPSHPLNPPSYTYFSVPYTGAFTQVTSDEHHQSMGEHTPLMINKNDT